MPPLSPKQKLKSLLWVTFGGIICSSGISYWNNDEKIYKKLIMPIIHLLDPEKAHKLGIFINKHRLLPKSQYKDPDLLKVKAFGLEFQNPIGIAAGYDKNGKAIEGLKDLGFGFIEIGSITPKPQPGNDKPRVFRLTDKLAVINRYGFNSDGHEMVYQRLQMVKEKKFDGIIGVNLGKNKLTTNPEDDYISGIKKFANLADYLVINISSPNTPGLRALQSKKSLEKLLETVVEIRNNLESFKPPILLKLSPDLNEQERQDIAQIIKKKKCQVDGLIICNTTTEKPDGFTEIDGGLSGKPLNERSTQMIKEMYKLTDGLPIIGVGGVSSGLDAYDKIKAGAILIQIYTAMIYEGPTIIERIKKELCELLENDGFKNVGEAVGKSLK